LSATRQLAAAQKGSLADPRQYFGGLDTAATAGSRLGKSYLEVLLNALVCDSVFAHSLVLHTGCMSHQKDRCRH
jgi:hypothetical protein